MLAGNYNITIDQGAFFERLLTVKNPDGTLFDLTDFTARMHIRTELDSDEIMCELTTENGRIALGGEAGTVTLSIESDVTEDFDDEGVYDLELIDSEGKVFRLLKGKVRVELEVTR